MTELIVQEPSLEWARRWRVARGTVLTSVSWILTLPTLARFMRWSRHTALRVQGIAGTISGLVWGRIGWVGVRRYGFGPEDVFLAGGLAGMITPTLELILRHLGWPPGPEPEPLENVERPSLSVLPRTWFWGFVFGGLVASVGALLARRGRD